MTLDGTLALAIRHGGQLRLVDGRACAAGARAIDELDLEMSGTHHSGSTVTLREMVLTVLLDTTRHAGHADVVRELIDGRGGSRPGDPMSPDDPEYLRMYRARITGEIDRETWIAYVKSRPGQLARED